MPYPTLSPEQQRKVAQTYGMDPAIWEWDWDAEGFVPKGFTTPVTEPNITTELGKQTKNMEILRAAGRGAAESILPTLGGAAAAGGTLALLGGPVGWGAGLTALGAGLLGSIATSKLQRAVTPDPVAEAIFTRPEDIQKHPIATALGSVAGSLPTFRPSPYELKTLAQAIGVLGRSGRPIGAVLKPAEKSALFNAALQGVMGGGISVGEDVYAGQPVDVGRALVNALGNVALNRPTRLGQAVGLKVAPEQGVLRGALGAREFLAKEGRPVKAEDLAFTKFEEDIRSGEFARGVREELKRQAEIEEQAKEGRSTVEEFQPASRKWKPPEATEDLGETLGPSEMAKYNKEYYNKDDVLGGAEKFLDDFLIPSEIARRTRAKLPELTTEKATNLRETILAKLVPDDLLKARKGAKSVVDIKGAGVKALESYHKLQSEVTALAKEHGLMQSDVRMLRRLADLSEQHGFRAVVDEYLGTANTPEQRARMEGNVGRTFRVMANRYLVGVHPTKARAETAYHEGVEALMMGLEDSTDPYLREFRARAERIIKKSPEYKAAVKHGVERGLADRPLEWLAQRGGLEYFRRAAGGDNFIKELYKDLRASFRYAVNKANVEDLGRIISARLEYGRAGGKVVRAETEFMGEKLFGLKRGEARRAESFIEPKVKPEVKPEAKVEEPKPIVKAPPPEEKKEEAPEPTKTKEEPKKEGDRGEPSFVTKFGSEYWIDDLGRTTRLKKSPGLRSGELHEPSPLVYLTPEAAADVIESSGSRIILIDSEGNKFAPKQLSDIRGKNLRIAIVDRLTGKVVTVHPTVDTPKIGYHPFEVYYKGDKKYYHIGNEIVKLKEKVEVEAKPEPKKEPEIPTKGIGKAGVHRFYVSPSRADKILNAAKEHTKLLLRPDGRVALLKKSPAGPGADTLRTYPMKPALDRTYPLDVETDADGNIIKISRVEAKPKAKPEAKPKEISEAEAKKINLKRLGEVELEIKKAEDAAKLPAPELLAERDFLMGELGLEKPIVSKGAKVVKKPIPEPDVKSKGAKIVKKPDEAFQAEQEGEGYKLLTDAEARKEKIARLNKLRQYGTVSEDVAMEGEQGFRVFDKDYAFRPYKNHTDWKQARVARLLGEIKDLEEGAPRTLTEDEAFQGAARNPEQLSPVGADRAEEMALDEYSSLSSELSVHGTIYRSLGGPPRDPDDLHFRSPEGHGMFFHPSSKNYTEKQWKRLREKVDTLSGIGARIRELSKEAPLKIEEPPKNRSSIYKAPIEDLRQWFIGRMLHLVRNRTSFDKVEAVGYKSADLEFGKIGGKQLGPEGVDIVGRTVSQPFARKTAGHEIFHRYISHTTGMAHEFGNREALTRILADWYTKSSGADRTRKLELIRTANEIFKQEMSGSYKWITDGMDTALAAYDTLGTQGHTDGLMYGNLFHLINEGMAQGISRDNNILNETMRRLFDDIMGPGSYKSIIDTFRANLPKYEPDFRNPELRIRGTERYVKFLEKYGQIENREAARKNPNEFGFIRGRRDATFIPRKDLTEAELDKALWHLTKLSDIADAEFSNQLDENAWGEYYQADDISKRLDTDNPGQPEWFQEAGDIPGVVEGESMVLPSPPHRSRFGWYNPLKSVTDRIRDHVEVYGDKIATALESFWNREDHLLGRWRYMPHKLLSKIGLNKNEIENLGRYVHAVKWDITKKPTLSAREKDAFDIVLKTAEDIQDYADTLGIPRLDTKKGRHIARRAPIKGQLYLPDIFSDEAIDILVNRTHSKEYEELRSKVIAYNDQLFKRAGTPKDYEELRRAFEAYVSHFREAREGGFKITPERLGQSLAIPDEYRENHIFKLIEKFGRRMAHDMSYYQELQDPVHKRDIATLLGIQDPEGRGKKIYTKGLESMAGHSLVRNAMELVHQQYYAYSHPRLHAGMRAVSSAILGTATGIRDIVSSFAQMLPYGSFYDVARATARARLNWKRNIDASLLTGARVGTLEDLRIWGEMHSTDKTSQVLNHVANFMRKWSGRDWLENISRTLSFSVGRELAAQNIMMARRGNIRAQKWVEKFGNLVDTSDLAKLAGDENALDTMAKNFVDRVQGMYDPRGLSRGAFESPLAPFMAMSRWSIEKANTIRKDVLQPLLQGDWRPALNYTFGSFLTGAAMAYLNKELSGKKPSDPTFKEVMESGDWEDYAAKFMSLMQLGSFAGIMSDAGKTMSDLFISREMPRGLSFPLVNFVTDDLGQGFLDMNEAIAQGANPIDALGGFLFLTLKSSVQTWRMAEQHIWPSTVERIKREEAFRDYRVYKKLKGEPVPRLGEIRANRLLKPEVRRFKETEDIGEAMELLPGLISDAMDRADGDIERFRRELKNIKQNNLQTFPSLEETPQSFLRYVQHLEKTQGKEKAHEKMLTFVRRKMINKAKSSMVPSL